MLSTFRHSVHHVFDPGDAEGRGQVGPHLLPGLSVQVEKVSTQRVLAHVVGKSSGTEVREVLRQDCANQVRIADLEDKTCHHRPAYKFHYKHGYLDNIGIPKRLRVDLPFEFTS